jgi:transposase
MAQTFIGVDVSKDQLDVFDAATGRYWTVANETAALRRFARSAAGSGARVVLEATGGYDRPLTAALAAAGAEYARVNPARARHFAEAAGLLAKTDRVDAGMLARMGAALGLAADAPPDRERERLTGLLRRRGQLVETRKREQTAIQQEPGADIRAEMRRMIALLTRRVEAYDARIAALIEETPALARAAGRMRTVPGIGPVSAAVLLAHLPELGTIDRRAVAALAGLAPVPRDSGRRRPARRIGGGRAQVRRLLYLAALQAPRACPRLKAFKDRLTSAGKAPKQVLIAIARKLLVILNAMIRTARDYSETAQ